MSRGWRRGTTREFLDDAFGSPEAEAIAFGEWLTKKLFSEVEENCETILQAEDWLGCACSDTEGLYAEFKESRRDGR